MHVPYCNHCEGPHTLYHNDRHAFLFLSLSLIIIKNAPQIQQPDTAYDFLNIKKTEYIWKLYSSRSFNLSFIRIGLETKEVIAFLVMRWKSRNVNKFVLPGTPIFDFFSTCNNDSKFTMRAIEWRLFHQIGPFSVRDIQGGRIVPPPVNVVQKAHQ